ncbi:hypothetical protein [Methylobacterium longum]|uniref:Uncharacterized protein n=1 Tax=Methylobacterium longum TaxID=767694 RepID=A0ABT8AI92_9HYPH|nr:hypothetical protein [Methylobacterium longum]MDN3569261.1 hypothetical protein [Methylobacterium longum]GJE14262.1 hypothetical protein FOHLNKBM_5335 [Methylobacterium longum]
MTDAGQERFAAIVADNVISTLERVYGGKLEPEDRRDRTIAELMHEMLANMPTTSGRVLAQACNRVLAIQPDRGNLMPLVSEIDMTDGAVTMNPLF